MIRWSLSLVVLGVVLSAGAGVVPAPTQEMEPEQLIAGLESVIERALAQSPRAVDGELRRRAAEARREASASVTLPRVSAGAEGSWRHETRRDSGRSSTGFKYFYNFSLEQAVYHWGALSNEKAIGRIRHAIAQGEVDVAMQELRVELTRQYAELIGRRLELQAARRQLALQSRRLDFSRQRADRGELADETLLAEELTVESLRLEIERGATQLSAAAADFAALAGLSQWQVDDLPESVEALPEEWVARAMGPALDGAIESGGYRNQELMRLRHESEIARRTVEIERMRLRPKLNLVAGSMLEEISYSANVAERFGVRTHFVGLRVNWAIFDGHFSRAITREARINARRAEDNLTQAERAVARRVRAERSEIALLARELSLAERRFEVSARALQRSRTERAEGQLAEDEWEARSIEHERLRIALVRLRLAMILRVSEHALLTAEGRA
jgi:outer membrane protein TolC